MGKKYDENFLSDVEDKINGFKGRCALNMSHLKVVYTKSTYWTYAISDDEYFLQKMYDQLIYNNLNLKKKL